MDAAVVRANETVTTRERRTTGATGGFVDTLPQHRLTEKEKLKTVL